MTKKKLPQPTSEKQILANQKNCQHCAGTKSPEGLAQSAQNRVTHGCARGSLHPLPSVGITDFEAYLETFINCFEPRSLVEAEMLDQFVTNLVWTRYCERQLVAAISKPPFRDEGEREIRLIQRYKTGFENSSQKHLKTLLLLQQERREGHIKGEDYIVKLAIPYQEPVLNHLHVDLWDKLTTAEAGVAQAIRQEEKKIRKDEKIAVGEDDRVVNHYIHDRAEEEKAMEELPSADPNEPPPTVGWPPIVLPYVDPVKDLDSDPAELLEKIFQALAKDTVAKWKIEDDERFAARGDYDYPDTLSDAVMPYKQYYDWRMEQLEDTFEYIENQMRQFWHARHMENFRAVRRTGLPLQDDEADTNTS